MRIIKCINTAIVALALLSGTTFNRSLAAEQSSRNEVPLNEQLTAQAWADFSRGRYREALESADRCVEEFLGAAILTQEKLTDAKAKLPTGKVSEAQKKSILENGLINDVGTCLFIKGRCHEKLGQDAVAKAAHAKAEKLTYARCWDPKGWFWAPAEASAGRKRQLDF